MRKDSILQNYYYSQLPKAEDGKEYTGSSIVDYLATKGYSGKKAFRKELAEQYGIENYDFSAAKNLELLSKIKENEEVLKKIQPSYAPIPVEKMMQMEKEATTPKAVTPRYTSLPNKRSEEDIKKEMELRFQMMMSSPFVPRGLPPINFGFKTKLKRDPVAFRSNVQPDRVPENKTQQLPEKSPLDFQGRHKKGNYLANFKPKPQVVAVDNGVRAPHSLPTEQTGLKFPLFPGTPSKVNPAVDNGFRAPYNPPSESTQSLPFPLFPQFGSTSGSTNTKSNETSFFEHPLDWLNQKFEKTMLAKGTPHFGIGSPEASVRDAKKNIKNFLTDLQPIIKKISPEIAYNIGSYQRRQELKNNDNLQETKTKFTLPVTEDVNEKLPPVILGDTIKLAYDPKNESSIKDRYIIPGQIDLNNTEWGIRNRGDYRPIDTQGGDITLFEDFIPAQSYFKNNPNSKETDSFIGVNDKGKVVVGTKKDFINTNIPISRTFSNKIVDFDRDNSGKIKLHQADEKASSRHLVPTTTTIDDNGKIVKGSINFLVPKGNKDTKSFGEITGGRIIFASPDGKDIRLATGSPEDVAAIFYDMKKKGNYPYITAYTNDNGTYGPGLRKMNGKITTEDLKKYQGSNKTGSVFLYLKGNPTAAKKTNEGTKFVSSFKDITAFTPNIRTEKDESYLKGHPLVNEQKAIVLHHTGYSDEEKTNEGMSKAMVGVRDQFKNVGESSHVVIDFDGTRYNFARPDQVTFHAGKSIFNGRENVNDFGIGIEFQGDSDKKPLTDAQIESFVEYITPIIKNKKIPLENIITHKQIRKDYMTAHPEDKETKAKSDLNERDYQRIKQALIKKGLYKTKLRDGGLVKAQTGLPFEGIIFNALHKKGDYPKERQAVINQLANLPIYSPDVRYASYQEALPIWRTNVENVPIEVNPNSPAGGSAYYGYGAPAFDIRFPYQGTVQLDPRQGDLVNTGQRITQHELRHAAFDGRNFIPRWYGDALYSTARRPEQFDQGEHQNLLNERASMALGARQAIIDRFGLKPNVKIPRELFDRYNREILETSLRQGRPIEQFSDVDETLRGARNATDAYNIINFELPRRKKGGLVKYQDRGQVIFPGSDNTFTDLRFRVQGKINAEKNLDKKLIKDSEEAKKFMMDYYNSPMFQQLYNSSVTSDKKRGLTPKNLFTNLNQITYNHKNLIDNDPAIAGRAYGNIIKYDPSTGNSTYAPQIEIKNDQLFTNFPETAVHETSHWLDKLGVAIPQTDIDLMNKYYNTNQGNFLGSVIGAAGFFTDDDFRGYLADPTETLARLRSAKYLGKKKGIYNPFKEKVNKEQYKKIKNVMGWDGYNPIGQLELIYSPEQIIDMMNKIAKNKPESSNMAKYGGWLYRKYGPGGQTTDGCGPGYSKNQLTGECIPNGWTPSGYTALAGVTNQSKTSTSTPSYKPSSESVGTGVTSLQRKPELEQKINAKKSIDKQIQNQGEIKVAEPEEGVLSRAWNIISNPMTALSYKIKGQDIPLHFERGDKNILDLPVNLVNPATYINSGASLLNAYLHPIETSTTLGKAGTNLISNLVDNQNVFNDESNSKALELLGDAGNMLLLGESGALKSLNNALVKSTESGVLSNAHRINPLAGTFAGESKLPSWLQLNKLDDANAYWRLTRDPIEKGIYEGSYFNKGVPLTGDLANTFEYGSRPWMHRYSGLIYNPETGQMNRYFGPDYLFKVTDPSKMEPFLKFPEPHLRFFRSTEAMSPNSPGVTQFKKDWLQGWKEVPKQKKGGMIEDNRGQWAHPGKNTRIRSPYITMQGVHYPVLAKANNGMSTMMQPGQDYYFPGADYVDEFPKKKSKGGWLEKYS